jgi:hypothetical protein
LSVCPSVCPSGKREGENEARLFLFLVRCFWNVVNQKTEIVLFVVFPSNFQEDPFGSVCDRKTTKKTRSRQEGERRAENSRKCGDGISFLAEEEVAEFRRQALASPGSLTACWLFWKHEFQQICIAEWLTS